MLRLATILIVLFPLVATAATTLKISTLTRMAPPLFLG